VTEGLAALNVVWSKIGMVTIELLVATKFPEVEVVISIGPEGHAIPAGFSISCPEFDPGPPVFDA